MTPNGLELPRGSHYIPEARLKAGYYLAPQGPEFLEDTRPYFSELQSQTFIIIMAEPSIMNLSIISIQSEISSKESKYRFLNYMYLSLIQNPSIYSHMVARFTFAIPFSAAHECSSPIK